MALLGLIVVTLCSCVVSTYGCLFCRFIDWMFYLVGFVMIG